MLSDAHLHLSPALVPILRDQPMTAVISCATPAEYEAAQALQEESPWLEISCGIHPWRVEEGVWETMLPYLEKAAVIGEIGMDNVWCRTDLALQAEYFERQLAMAQAAHKPVVLHTKGMEKECLEMIKRYPNRYHVHWYSTDAYLEDYIDLGCYFSVGPFPSKDPAVANVAKKCPLDRLLIETDGLEAIIWAAGREVDGSSYMAVLRHMATQIGELRGMTKEEVLIKTNANLRRMLTP